MIIIGLLIYLALTVYMGFFAGDTGYFLAEQATHVILLSLIVSILNKGVAKAVAIGLLLLVCFELIDEVMGNNLRLFYNDFVGYGIALFTTIYLAKKWSNTKRTY